MRVACYIYAEYGNCCFEATRAVKVPQHVGALLSKAGKFPVDVFVASQDWQKANSCTCGGSISRQYRAAWQRTSWWLEEDSKDLLKRQGRCSGEADE
jgi:hypothetical protein